MGDFGEDLPRGHPRWRSSSALWPSRAPRRASCSRWAATGGCRSAASGARSTTTFKTPTNAAVAVGVLAAIPFLVSDSAAACSPSAPPASSTPATSCATWACSWPAPRAGRRRTPGSSSGGVGNDHQRPRPRLGRRDDRQLLALELGLRRLGSMTYTIPGSGGAADTSSTCATSRTRCSTRCRSSARSRRGLPAHPAVRVHAGGRSSSSAASYYARRPSGASCREQGRRGRRGDGRGRHRLSPGAIQGRRPGRGGGTTVAPPAHIREALHDRRRGRRPPWRAPR